MTCTYIDGPLKGRTTEMGESVFHESQSVDGKYVTYERRGSELWIDETLEIVNGQPVWPIDE